MSEERPLTVDKAKKQPMLDLPNLPAQRVVILAVLTLGISLGLLLLGGQPGWRQFIVAGLLAIIAMIFGIRESKYRSWLGLSAISALLFALFWRPNDVWATIVGISLVLINAYHVYRKQRDQEREAEELAAAQTVAELEARER
jgi:hypothetical protein